MEPSCRRWLGRALLAACVSAGTVGAVAAGQVELDRIVSRVPGHPIMQSDVRRARSLELVPDTTSDASTLRALENRWLMLDEIERAAPALAISDDAVEARFEAWRARPRRAEPLLPISDVELRRWFRNDLRIDAYLDRRFGMLSGADRSRAQNAWVARLRQRAELD